MASPIELTDLVLSEHAALFQGKNHGSGVSFFVRLVSIHPVPEMQTEWL